jgi:hypothetical protein
MDSPRKQMEKSPEKKQKGRVGRRAAQNFMEFIDLLLSHTKIIKTPS